jgi:hypothetical protein
MYESVEHRKRAFISSRRMYNIGKVLGDTNAEQEGEERNKLERSEHMKMTG